MYHPPDFNRVFRDGETFKINVYPPREKTLQIELVNLGELSLPTGKIVAFDPSYSEYTAFDRSVPSGNYPVWLAIAQFDDEFNNRGIAGAIIKFDEKDAIDWQIALIPLDTDVYSGQTDNFYCYGVDAGLGCFADEMAASALVTKLNKLNDRSSYIAFIDSLNEQSIVPRLQCVNMIVDPASRLNICVFNSGYGDGCYASYWGIGADGSIVSLATDFMLGHVDDENEE